MFPPRFTFQPALLPTLATLIMVMVTAAMGTWQLNRAAEKAALQREYDARASAPPAVLPNTITDPKSAQYRRFEIYGKFEKERQIYLDNKIHNGVAGFSMITPMRINNSDTRVLINRGWIAAGRERKVLPHVETPNEVVRIVGIAHIPGQKIFELSSNTVEGRVWQNLTLERYQKTVPFPVQPFVILQENASDDGLIREWQRPDSGRQVHLGYAFQWYAISIVLIIIYVVVNTKRAR